MAHVEKPESDTRLRRFMGIVALVSAMALAFIAIVYQPPRFLRALVFIPLWLAGIGLLSERAHKRATTIAAALTIILVALP